MYEPIHVALLFLFATLCGILIVEGGAGEICLMKKEGLYSICLAKTKSLIGLVKTKGLFCLVKTKGCICLVIIKGLIFPDETKSLIF